MEASNNAKLREALDEILERIDTWRTDGSMAHWQYSQLFDIADAALAEPVRNCEVGTAEEQAKRMDAYCARNGERIGCSWRCDNCPLCSIDRCDLVWAQMPYVEKEGGDK